MFIPPSLRQEWVGHFAPALQPNEQAPITNCADNPGSTQWVLRNPEKAILIESEGTKHLPRNDQSDDSSSSKPRQ